MNHEEFNQVVARRFGLSQKILAGKATEYASDSDRFHNFNVAGAAMNVTSSQALWGMFMKHFVSVQDMVQSGKTPDQEWIDEKIADAINYFLLLEGLFMAKVAKEGEKTDGCMGSGIDCSPRPIFVADDEQNRISRLWREQN